MKKAIVIVVLFLIGLGLLGWIGWMRKTSIAAHILQKHLGVPVALKSLDFTPQGALLTDLAVHNPKGFQSPSAFTAQSIEIDTTLSQLRSDPLTIDKIEMNNLLLTIETSPSGKTNWDQILGNAPNSPGKRHWLIKTLTLNNLTVQVIQPNGSIKVYPTLAHMQFNNLSEETGFPVDEIEKAIFNEVMKNLLRNFNLQNLLHPVMPQGLPLPSLPSLF